MKAFITLPRHWLALAALTAVATASGRELELSGSYDDEGTVMVAAPDQPADSVVSLHALLSLEFVPGLARRLHEQAAQVVIRHEGKELEIQVINHEGEAIWHETWKQGEGYGLEGERLVLRFKSGRDGRDEYVLNLETVSTHRLLQVEVLRLTPTVLGPSVHPLGIYLFHRLE